MIIEIIAPTPGESIAEVEIASWLVEDGQYVDKNQELAEIESDKATLSLTATESGKLHILKPAGTTVKVGEVVCSIDTSVAGVAKETSAKPVVEESVKPEAATTPKASTVVEPVTYVSGRVKVSPVAQKVMAENGWSVDDVINGIRRLSAADVVNIMTAPKAAESSSDPSERKVNRAKMTQLRKKLSQRLVAVKNETAMLTTFNEIDMSAVMSLREKYQKEFVAKHDVKLGFMSFFIKAAAMALKNRPAVNSMIDGDDIITPDYADISVAVQTPKGLMVPVIRDAHRLSLAQIEHALKQLADKARTGKITLEEMTGGTFTITNGGVFGSMMSTPLINPPQSAILGMHNIIDRPVAINGRVEIRPMMYVALSYDHRIIDGKDSVGFLTDLKKYVEKPVLFINNGMEIDKTILDI
jgi:2-oxoglutarate dehydrogenase E2 component (dihydrolipoamide succinyltransferase)